MNLPNYFYPVIIFVTGILFLFFLYSMIDEKSDTLVISPLLTANAYTPNAFYDFFEKTCNESCLTVPINMDVAFGYASSVNALIILNQKGFDIVHDYNLVSDPNLIYEYDNVILLHNEYVTKEIYESIINHPNVFYLYPNALYGEVIVKDGSMTLINGHGVNGKDNGFDWKFENTRPDEFDDKCLNYSWNKVDNGYQLNCYPEYAIITDDSILEFIFEKVD